MEDANSKRRIVSCIIHIQYISNNTTCGSMERMESPWKRVRQEYTRLRNVLNDLVVVFIFRLGF